MRNILWKMIGTFGLTAALGLVLTPSLNGQEADLGARDTTGFGAGRDARLGLGITFSGPTGLSIFYDYDDNNFSQASVAFSRDNAFVLTGDYAWAYPMTEGAVTPYWGIGALVGRGAARHALRRVDRTGEGDQWGAGLRIPLGVNFIIPQTPLQIGGELVPTLAMGDATEAYMTGGLHIRILF
jgi:hypothetical protein